MAKLDLVDVYSTGPKPPIAVRPVFHLLNVATLAGTAVLKFKRRARTDHYFNRLALGQIWELNRDVSLIAIARKRVDASVERDRRLNGSDRSAASIPSIPG